MMKFFRKYTKHLLVFLVIGILVSWLLGSSLQAILQTDPGASVVGSAFGEEIQRRDVDRAAGEGWTLNRMGIPWSRPWIISPLQYQQDPRRALDPLHWLLLVREARQSGLVITEEQVRSFKTAIQLDPAVLDGLRRERSLALDTLNEMIRGYLLVREYASQNTGTAFVSTPEVRRLVRDTTERVRARTVVISAEKLVDESEPVEEAEIRSVYEKFKSVLPGEGELGAGYKWPARVRVEYLVLNVSDVSPVVTVTEREARDYWTQNKAQFTRSAEDVAETQVSDEQPESKEGGIYDTFAEARSAVVEYLRGAKAEDRAEQVMSDLLSLELSAAWDFTKRDSEGYPKVPDAVRREGYYEEILRALAHTEPRIAPLIEVRMTELSTAEQIGQVPGIGGSFFALVTGERHDFVSLTQSVQGLGQMPDTGGSELRSLYLSQFQSTDRVLKDFSGNCYGFRVIEVAEPAEPGSVEEVRERVIDDIRMSRSYARTGELAERIAEAARGSSLDEAVAEDVELQELLGDEARVQEGGMTPRMWAPGLPAMIAGHNDPSVVEFVFGLAGAFDAEGTHPIGAVGAPMRGNWLVVEVADMQPVTEDVYERVRGQRRSQLMQQRMSAARSEWFRPERIEQRTAWAARDPDA